MNKPNISAIKPWYKEPWLWGVLAGPVLVIPAGIITYYLAIHEADTVVSDDYYREGKNIHLQMARDQLAQTKQLQAQVLFSPEADSVRVFVQGKYRLQDALTLSITHPTLAALDQNVTLELIDTQLQLYEAKIKPLPKMNEWYVRIQSDSERWRIQGKWWVANGPNLLLTPKYAKVPLRLNNSTH